MLQALRACEDGPQPALALRILRIMRISGMPITSSSLWSCTTTCERADDADGAMEVVRGGGTIRTKRKLGYGQYHVEWRTPEVVKGSGQGRGNSGFFPLGGPEVQVLDSYENSTYSHGQAGAVYNRYPPLVNACRAPGVWQTYDVIVHSPIQDEDGKYVRKSAYTVLHNGVLIQDNMEVGGQVGKTGQLALQDHGNPVRYRNIWFRPYRDPIPMKRK